MDVLKTSNSYNNFKIESLSDKIGIDQFMLAIERNFLLHITTGLNMIVVGMAMFRFFSVHSNDIYAIVGILSFLISLMVMSKGLYDFIKNKKMLNEFLIQQ